ncbi:MAG: hypothetical protein D3910_01090 [Candidatus Electrothrix sp. ATG2]|nr:hypothetical protein [Candidatus Electrothrix sp. ATG2]
MSDLEFHIQRLIAWVQTQEGCPSNWSDIQIVEDTMPPLRKGELWNIPKKSLQSIKQYEERFNELLMKGYHWVNINFGGIYQKRAILFIEYPRNSFDAPKDKVSVNLSGPAGCEWDLSKKICVIE